MVAADISQPALIEVVVASAACEMCPTVWPREVKVSKYGSLFCLSRLVAVMAIMMLMLLLLVVMAVGPGSLALSAPGLLLVHGRAQHPPVLLIPRAQRLASKHEVVVVDDGGHHPRLAGQVGLVGGRVGDVQVGHDHARLRRAVWCRALG